jgi:hypothetical protein
MYYSRRTSRSTHRPMTQGAVSRMLLPMKATPTTECHGCKCHGCSALVDCAQHLPLCDSCLDARLTALEHSSERPSKRTGTLRWPGGWRGALAVGDALRVAA